MEQGANPETDVVRHEVKYRGRIVDLVVDTVRMPSGRDMIREVVRHPGGVVAIPVLDDGRLILVRQFRYPLQKFILEFPAGKLEGKRSPLENIMRELEEETGYSAREMRFLCSFFTTPGFCDEVIHLFLATGLAPVGQRLEEGEHITLEPYSLEECLRMIASGEIEDAKTILGILWYRQMG